MIPVCLISGRSGSGKTTLLERLLPALATRGVATATVKHHRGAVEVDRPGKDTWRHRRAGARATFFVTAREVVAFFDRTPEMDIPALACLCPSGVDLLLVEGFKGLTGFPRIEVVRRGVEREIPCFEEVVCVATDIEGISAPCPVFALEDADGMADLLIRRVLSRGT